MKIAPETRLIDCPPASVTAKVPSPVGERLDALIELANRAGASTTRTEFVGVLVFHAPEDGQELLDRILDYRRATAGEARVKGATGRNVLEFKRHPRGPRPRAARSG